MHRPVTNCCCVIVVVTVLVHSGDSVASMVPIVGQQTSGGVIVSVIVNVEGYAVSMIVEAEHDMA